MTDIMESEFDRHQRIILALLDEGDAAVRVETADLARLGAVRWRLVAAVRAYQLHKHGRILDPAIARHGGHVAAMAEGLKAMCAAGSAQARDFVLAWSTRSPAAHWSEYRAASLALTAAIRDHLAIERERVAALAAAIKRAQLRQSEAIARSA